MLRPLILATLLLAGCGRTPVPTVPVWQLEGPWEVPPKEMRSKARVAPAAILVFRESGEFVELHCRVIEQPDATLYISRRDPRVAAVGVWKQRFSTIRATRHRVARTIPFRGAKDPLCENPELRFKIAGGSVIGRLGPGPEASYSTLDRLVAPDFDSYFDQARRSPVTCVKLE